MRITISTTSASIEGDLHDGGAGADFAAPLPLTVQLREFNRTEQIADMPRRLVTDGEPSAAPATAGDIAYYAPWGNLAIFYRDFSRSSGLVILGTLTTPITDLVNPEHGGIVTIAAARRTPRSSTARSCDVSSTHTQPRSALVTRLTLLSFSHLILLDYR